MKSVLIMLVAASAGLGAPIAPHIKAASYNFEAAKSAFHEKRMETAAELFGKALQIEPTFLEAYEGLVDARLASNQRLEAAAVITRFLEIWPETTHYRLILAQILQEQKQTQRALAQFSAVLKSEPFNPDALLGFAATAQQIGLGDRASQALRRGMERYPLDSRFKTPATATKPN